MMTRRAKDRIAALLSGLAKPNARRYTIEVKDARSGAVVMFTAVDWTETERRAGLTGICRAAGLPHDEDVTDRGRR